MQWNQYTITTTTKAEDLVCDLLMELGIEGVEIIDDVPLSKADQEKMYIDILPTLPPDLGVGTVKFYLEAGKPDQDEELLGKIKEGLAELSSFVDIGQGLIERETTEDTDWINNWKEFFHPFYLDDILIRPSWDKEENHIENGITIDIDPGTSFGTGQHETTQLCIRQLRKRMKKGDRVLDLGCGSGILSIICLKMESGKVTGVDIDPICMESTTENMERNGVSAASYQLITGNLIEDNKVKEQVGKNAYDVVVANILADVIIPMAPAAFESVRNGGIFITSGIIDFKEEPVKKALVDAGFIIEEVTRQGEWVCITAKK